MMRIILLLLVSSSLPSWAACDEDSTALRYLRTIEAMNWAGMRGFLAEDARYLDPTMAYFDRPAINLVGPDAIIGFWRDSADGTRAINYRVRDCFETAGIYVVNFDIAVEVEGRLWDVDTGTIDLAGKLTSIVTVDDADVVEHTDLVDYAAVDREVMRLRSVHGSLHDSLHDLKSRPSVVD